MSVIFVSRVSILSILIVLVGCQTQRRYSTAALNSRPSYAAQGRTLGSISSWSSSRFGGQGLFNGLRQQIGLGGNSAVSNPASGGYNSAVSNPAYGGYNSAVSNPAYGGYNSAVSNSVYGGYSGDVYSGYPGYSGVYANGGYPQFAYQQQSYGGYADMGGAQPSTASAGNPAQLATFIGQTVGGSLRPFLGGGVGTAGAIGAASSAAGLLSLFG